MPATIPLTHEEDSCYRLLRRLAFPELIYNSDRKAVRDKWRKANPPSDSERINLAEYRRLLTLAFPEKERAKDLKYRNKDRAEFNRRSRVRRAADAEKENERQRGRYHANPAKFKTQVARYARERKKRDVGFRLRCNLRRRVHLALTTNKAHSGSMKLLGCSIDSLKFISKANLKRECRGIITGKTVGMSIM